MKKKKVDKYRDFLHNAGLKATSDRMRILHVLEKRGCPVSVQDILKKTPQTNVVTIYRFLETLKNKGIVRQVNISDERKYFEIATGAHHHHIVCEKCGFVEKIDTCALDQIIKKQMRSCKKFATVTDHVFELYGLCKKCS